MTARRGRKRKQILDDIKQTSGCWKLQEAAQDAAVYEAWLCQQCLLSFSLFRRISRKTVEHRF